MYVYLQARAFVRANETRETHVAISLDWRFDTRLELRLDKNSLKHVYIILCILWHYSD